jgi:hypothetical protein
MGVRDTLQTKGYEQIPQLSSSRPTNLDEPFSLVPEGFSGTRRAVMVGINYVGDDPGELRGCHNDVLNVSLLLSSSLLFSTRSPSLCDSTNTLYVLTTTCFFQQNR